MTYRILILTDHKTHSKENSLYGLANVIWHHDKVKQVDIASRGNPDNDEFFYHLKTNILQVLSLKTNVKFQGSGKQFLHKTQQVSILDYDFIVLRLPRPIPNGFFDFLSESFDESCIINRPAAILETSNKNFLLEVSPLCPPIQSCKNLEDICAFQEEFPIVLKPIEDYGGKGILRVIDGKLEYENKWYPLLETASLLEAQFKRGGYLGMKFLRNVEEGDKRVLVVNGKVLGASLRTPPADSWLCNASQGGESWASEANEEEIWMAAELSKILLPKGIVIFGMDTLVNNDGKRVLSEVNTLSVGGIKQIEQFSKRPILQQTADLMISYLLNA